MVLTLNSIIFRYFAIAVLCTPPRPLTLVQEVSEHMGTVFIDIIDPDIRNTKAMRKFLLITHCQIITNRPGDLAI